MGSNLYEKTVYTSPYDYVQSTFIREYDIEKANINALIMNGIIDEKEYPWWCSLPKDRREVIIGKRSKVDKTLPVIILKTIKEARRLFIETNNIQDDKILAIKNDALYIIDDIPTHTTFGRMNFKMKQVYTSYYKIKRPSILKLFYYLDRINNVELLHVDGIDDTKIEIYHNDHMMDFLKALFYSIETEPLQDALSLVQDFYQSYINDDLDIEYYRQFSPLSQYDTIYHAPVTNSRYMINTNPTSKNEINKNYNLIIIQELYKLVSTLYFNKHQ